MFSRAVLLALSVFALCSAPAFAQQTAQAEIDFNRDIRPILSDNCFPCHGPDAANRQADLRFDLKDGLLADRGGYAAIVPGKPEESEALRRVLATEEYEQMPPPDSNLTLTDKQQELLSEWVRQGAAWSEHWAFVRPVKPELPDVQNADWPHDGVVLNGIDRFVLPKLRAAQLTPTQPADKETLIRRVTLDLTGLPPTPEEVDAFLADESEDAYETLVDRLLASPRYGERMAWPWLEAARYADTDGFQGDPTRQMWPWRDWLVEALNQNMPFDEFTIQMLAGDMLPDATIDQLVASGFNRNHMYNSEGGRIPEETRVENVFDRTETTATVWLGLTATCARCHDHKFDPLSQREYYQLYAFFNNTSESGAGNANGKAPPTMPFLTKAQRSELAKIEKQIEDITARIRAPHVELDAAYADWLAETREELRAIHAATPIAATELGEWSMVGPFAAPDGDAEKSFAHDFGPEALFGEAALDLQQTFGENNLGWAQKPQFADGKVHPLSGGAGATYLYRSFQVAGERTFQLSFGSDDGIKVWHNGKLVLENDTHRVAQPNQERLALTLPSGENRLLIKIVNVDGAAGFYFKRLGESFEGLPLDLAKAVVAEDFERDQRTQQRLLEHFRGQHSPEFRELIAARDRLQTERRRVQSGAATVMVMDELPADKRRSTHILERGTYNKPAEDEVLAAAPQFLPSLPIEGTPNRLDLARWLVDERNPLTARVTVNRYWQLFFGAGLVSTGEDFGRQGTLPTHPQLLDWLATTFVESGWDVKAMHKLIVMSATYRQASESPGDDSSYVRDPKNELLSRGPRHRLPSWMLRDQALAASGLLNGERGGPPVKPYQPEGIWAEATFGAIKYQQGGANELHRRSLYTFWRRIVGPPVFFDAGKRQTCEVKPSRTNSPLHALTTWNETTFVESARALAQRVMQEVPAEENTPADELHPKRLSLAFRLLTAREPEERELKILASRWRKLVTHFAAHPEEALQLLSVGESPRDDTLDAAEHAAYAAVCSLLLNLDEVLSKE